MEDFLSAIEVVPPEVKEEGVLESFLRNARHLLCSGMIATTLLASVATIQKDYVHYSCEPLVQLVLECESLDKIHADDLLNRLSEFASLEAGWNNDGSAKPIDEAVLTFLNKVIAFSDSADWQKWLVFPEQRGSVMLDYDSENCRASISIGNDGFSYMAYGPGFYDTAERAGLSEIDLLSFVKKVKGYGRA